MISTCVRHAAHVLESHVGALTQVTQVTAVRRGFPLSLARGAVGARRRSGNVLCVRSLAARSGAMGCSTSKLEVKKSDDYVEGFVCQDADIGENQMKAFQLEDAGKVLVVRQNGKLSAIGAKCTHYGAPLETGVLGDGRVRCPWHGACFNIANGDIEDFPGLDSLPCYEVKVEDSKVKVRARRSEISSNKRTKTMCSLDTKHPDHIVVIGGGPAGATCAETLRQEGYTGKLTMVAKENALPYDRVKLSKAMDVDIEKLQFRNDAFYKQNNIEVLKNVQATNVDSKLNTVTLNNGNVLSYSKLFVATGCTPMRPTIPGSDLPGVVVLRTFEDARLAHGMLNSEQEVVILGASFIALEAASYCAGKVKGVTVVGRDAFPFRQLLGPEIGVAVMKLYEEKGVHFRMNSGIRGITGTDCVKEVELVNGDRVKADVVIMGVGSTFSTELLQGSGVELLSNGAVEVNEFMQSNVSNVYVGGDIAHAPVFSSDNQKSAIGHYSLAHYHGRVAGMNMMGKETPVKSVPFFWTMLFGKGIRYAGHGKHDDILYTGNVSDLKFAAFYLKGDRVIAVSSCGMDPVVARYAELRAQGKELYRQDLGEDLLGWSK